MEMQILLHMFLNIISSEKNLPTVFQIREFERH